MKMLFGAALFLLGSTAAFAQSAPESVMSEDKSNAIVNFVNGNEDCKPSKRDPSQCLPVVSDTRQILFGTAGPAKPRGRSGGGSARAAVGPVNLGINFLIGSAALTETSRRSLDRLAASFVKAGKATTQFFVDGHTDRTGTCEVNLNLSQARANAAVEYLAAAGVDRQRMTARGFGYDKLKDTNNPNAGANRRVEVVPKKIASDAPAPTCS